MAGAGSLPTASSAGNWGNGLPSTTRSGRIPPPQQLTQLVDFFLQRAISPRQHKDVDE
jgi:hypothetical protein